MSTVTKKDLIERIADATGQKRVAVKKTVQQFLDQMVFELASGNRLEFRDFGVFEVKNRAPRMAQNPKTLERVPVPAKKTVKFKVGRKMQELLDADTRTLEVKFGPGVTAPLTGKTRDELEAERAEREAGATRD